MDEVQLQVKGFMGGEGGFAKVTRSHCPDSLQNIANPF